MHDKSYKLLFSHARMVEDLMRGFIAERWVNEVDFSTLERWNSSYVSDNLRERHDDVIWRVRFRETWLYLYLLLEFQSTEDTFMAVRIAAYISLLYQDLVNARQLKPDKKLPAILPIVLYNGEPRWRAATDLSELLEPMPAELGRYQLRQQYLLLDEGAYSDTNLAPLPNLVSALFRLENTRAPSDILQVVEALIEWLNTPEQTGLRRAFTVWLRRVVLRDSADIASWEQVNELDEVRTMLAERVEQWKRDWREEGRQEGLNAERTLLYRLTYRRFGEDTAEQMSSWLQKVDDTDQLAEIGEWIIDCENGNELMVRIRQLLNAD